MCAGVRGGEEQPCVDPQEVSVSARTLLCVSGVVVLVAVKGRDQ